MNILDQFNAMNESVFTNFVARDFVDEPGGPSVDALRALAFQFPHMQERRSQLIMASVIDRCFREGLSTAIEAPTGTGKSKGYLIPSVLSGHTTVISTSNKALQKQLFEEEVPFIQSNIKTFKAALLKGKNNFLCLKRLEEYMRIDDSIELSNLEAALSLHEGDFEKIGYESNLRSEINGDDSCTRKKCPHRGDCYYYKNKDKADDADIIITNNAMLMADVQSGGHALPPYTHLVLDEAHNLEKDAQNALTTEVTLGSVLSLISRKLVKRGSTYEALNDIRESANRLFGFEYKQDKTIFNMTIREGLFLSQLIKDLSVVLLALKSKDDDYEELAGRAENLSIKLGVVCEVKQENVHYVEKKGDKYKIVCTPLDVSELLHDKLFSEKVVAATSATLATKDGFDFFTKRVGMETQIQPKSLPSPFDYKNNALLYIPRDIEPPSGDHWSLEKAKKMYWDKLSARMQELVMCSGGRAFLLFTSYTDMNAVHERLALPYPVLKQGGDVAKDKMIERFKEQPSVLMGVRTFWEGIDIAGEDLSLVVVAKVPFPTPEDPIVKGISSMIKRRGGNDFSEYSLPNAIISLKQGVGRLIRTSTDRGVMAILDARLRTKGYGAKIIGSLPPAPLTSEIADIEKFFS